MKLSEQLGLHAYAVSTHPDELVLEPPPKKKPGSAYAAAVFQKFVFGDLPTIGF